MRGISSRPNRSERMKLYQGWLSSASWRVRWALAIKGLAYDSVWLDIAAGEHRERLAGIHPLLSVPTLQLDDGEILLRLESGDADDDCVYLKRKRRRVGRRRFQIKSCCYRACVSIASLTVQSCVPSKITLTVPLKTDAPPRVTTSPPRMGTHFWLAM